jgi:hypothetical protein
LNAVTIVAVRRHLNVMVNRRTRAYTEMAAKDS